MEPLGRPKGDLYFSSGHHFLGEEIELKNGDLLTIPELFGEWELPIVELWPPVFE